MDTNMSKYAIITRTTNASLATELALKDEILCLNAGTLIKVHNEKTALKRDALIVELIDFTGNNPLCNNLYECSKNNLQTISESVLPFLISIIDEERRLPYAKIPNTTHNWVFYVNVGDMVNVLGELFKKPKVRYNCIVRHIGFVQELNPVGYFFGLELLTLKNGRSPQVEISDFSQKYINCDPSLAIITTVDWIEKPQNDATKKAFTFDYLNDKIEKVVNVFNPMNNCVNNTTNTGTYAKNNKKEKKKQQQSSKFYDTTDSTISTSIEIVPTSDAMKKGDKINDLITMDCDSYQQTVHERNNIPKPPSGILKSNRSQAAGSGKENINKGNVNPSGLLSIEGRDLIVIDNAEIAEESRKESEVVIIEQKKKEKDLKDLCTLLGKDWPLDAGGMAAVLNNGKLKEEPTVVRSNNTMISKKKTERNKSSNVLSHIGQTTRSSTNNFEVKSHSNENAIKATIDAMDEDVVNGIDETYDEIPGNPNLGMGSMVQITLPNIQGQLFGVIRWIGKPYDVKHLMVGVELLETHDKKLDTSNGELNGRRLFQCQERRALFISPEYCAIDTRFAETEGAVGNYKMQNGYNQHQYETRMFGEIECPPVHGAVPPLKMTTLEQLERYCGNFKGIQGHNNSCYLDATLFSMFTFTSVFDSLLYRPPESDDIQHYAEVQKVLREEIVNPLRKNVYVRADRVMKLRQLLDELSTVSGLTSEEKDPEEFLNSLLTQIMRVEPFLKLNSGQNGYFYQLFVEKDERLLFPTVQELFEQSFYASDIKLKEVPSNLIIQMPRFGKDYKMYSRIVPSLELDVTDIIEDSPRQCSSCGKLAEQECRECFDTLQQGLEGTAYCLSCFKTIHSHSKRANHKSKPLKVPEDFRNLAETINVPRLKMELFAVVCIETSHYVTFVKTGSGPEAPWCFFDSMADRIGGINGHNIPVIKTIPDLPFWLSPDGATAINESAPNDKMLNEYAKRLFCDAYMCMYQSTDVMMYR